MLRRRKWGALVGLTTLSLIAPGAYLGAQAAPTNDQESGYYENVSHDQLRALWADSEEPKLLASYHSGPKETLVDGDYATFWMSYYTPPKPPKDGEKLVDEHHYLMPHSFVIGTADDKPLSDIGRVTLSPLRTLKGLGTPKDYQIFTRSDGKCEADESGWEQVADGHNPVDNKKDLVSTFSPRLVKCVKVVVTSAWLGKDDKTTERASLAEVSLGKFMPGDRPLADPAPSAPKQRPLPEGARNSNEVLLPLALDGRRADNPDRTPIALRVPGADGKTRIVGARPSDTPPVQDLKSVTGKAYFVDCLADPAQADGSQEHPYTKLEDINNHEPFKAGDAILLKRGTRCTGLLHPLGSGEKGNHIVLSAYGNPADPLPRIDGKGIELTKDSADTPAYLKENSATGVDSPVVRLYNQEYWTIRNLEITNFSNDENDYQRRRRGLLISLEDYGQGKGYEISNLYIHDMLGEPAKQLGGSTALTFESYGTKGGKDTSFAEVKVHHNRIRHVSRTAIMNGSSFRKRPSVGAAVNSGPALHFVPWGPMEIHDNIISDVVGDGIITQFAHGSYIHHNTVWDVSNHHNGYANAGNNAGIWPWDADNVRYTENHVFDTKMPDGTWDGTAFDADYGTTGTLYEHNVTHDNEGGFMLFCGCGGMSTNSVARFNLSLNDGRGADTHSYGPRIFSVLGQTNGQVYNNTFLMYPNVQVERKSTQRNNITYQNNVFLAQGGKVRTTLKDPALANTLTFRNNLYAGAEADWPTPDRNLVKPDLHPLGTTGIAGVKVADEEVKGKSQPIDAGTKQLTDLAGVDIPANVPADLGALQVAPAANLDAPTVVNGGFENGNEAWTLGNGAMITADVSRGGKNSVFLPDGNTWASQITNVAVNRTYRVVAAVKPAKDGSYPALKVINPEGHAVQLAPLGSAGKSASAAYAEAKADKYGFVPVSAVVRTSWDASTLELKASGSGYVDDVALIPVDDYIVDGAFQSFGNVKHNEENSPWLGLGEYSKEDKPISGILRSDVAVSGHRALYIPGEGAAPNEEVVVPDTETAYELSGWFKSEGGSQLELAVPKGVKEPKSLTSQASDYTQLSTTIVPTMNRFTVVASAKGGEGAKAYFDDVTLVKAWDGQTPLIGGERPTPVKPAPENPGTPAPEQPVTPAPEQPGTPVKPAPEQPVTPAPEKPVTPAPEQPANPAPEQPAQPEQPAPAKPAPAKPAKPAPTQASDGTRPLLPRTGTEALALGLVAILLIGTGIAIRRSATLGRK